MTEALPLLNLLLSKSEQCHPSFRLSGFSGVLSESLPIIAGNRQRDIRNPVLDHDNIQLSWSR